MVRQLAHRNHPVRPRLRGSARRAGGDARRFDVSFAWHAWAGAEPSLAHLVEWQATGLPDEVKGLAGRLAAGVGRPEPSASIVRLRVHDAEVAERALAEAGVRCAARGGNIRLSPHIYNTEADIDQPIAAVARFLT